MIVGYFLLLQIGVLDIPSAKLKIRILSNSKEASAMKKGQAQSMEKFCKKCKRMKKQEMFCEWESVKCRVCEEEDRVVQAWRKRKASQQPERVLLREEKRNLKRKKRETRQQKTCKRIHERNL